MTIAASIPAESTSTTTAEGALRPIDTELLDAVVGGCAACGTPGAPCATTATGGGSADVASLFAASFARR